MRALCIMTLDETAQNDWPQRGEQKAETGPRKRRPATTKVSLTSQTTVAAAAAVWVEALNGQHCFCLLLCKLRDKLQSKIKVELESVIGTTAYDKLGLTFKWPVDDRSCRDD